MRAILAIAFKDLRLLVADKLALFFALFWPLIFVLFFGVVLGGMYGDDALSAIRVAVVDEDDGRLSRLLLQELADGAALELVAAEDRAAAEGLVRRGRCAAALFIPAGFSSASEQLFLGEPMKLELVADPARPMEGAMTQGVITAAAYAQLQSVFTSSEQMLTMLGRARTALEERDDTGGAQTMLLRGFIGASEQFFRQFDFAAVTTQPGDGAAAEAGAVGFQPVVIDVRTAGAEAAAADAGTPRRGRPSVWAIVFPQGMCWGAMACAATFGLILVVERTRGTLPRLMGTPVSRWQILAGKALACFLTAAGVIAAMLLLARFGFGVRPNSTALLVLATLSVSVAIVGIMMLFAVLGRTEAAVGGMSWAVIVIMAMLGGGMIPLAAMSGWMQTISYVSIFRWSILALEGAIWRGFGPAEMALPCGILLAIGIGGFGIGTAVFRWRG